MTRGLELQYRVYTALLSLALLYFHGFTGYLSTRESQTLGMGLVGLLIISYALFTVVIRRRSTAESSLQSDVDYPSMSLVKYGVLVGFVALCVVGIRSMPTWSEEVWWIELAKSVVNGDVIHLIGFKGDNPANIQAWPVALSLILTGDPILAARLPGVFYNLLLIYFVAQTVAVLSGARQSILVYVLPTCSLWMIHYARIGYNDNSSVPVLIAAQLYFAIRVFVLGDMRSLTWLAAWVSLSFTTLYTPFIFCLLMLGLLASGLRQTKLTRQLRFDTLLLVWASIAPTLGKMIQYPEQALGRHARFLLRGNEWEKQTATLADTLTRYQESSAKIFSQLLPSSTPESQLNFDSLFGANLEPITFLFLVIGLFSSVWVVKSRVGLVLLFLSAFWMLCGLIASNPGTSTWRTLCLAPFLFIFAGLGVQWLPQLCTGRLRLMAATSCVVLSLHLYWFGQRYLMYIKQNWFIDRVEGQVQIVSWQFSEQLRDGNYLLVLDEGLPIRYLRAYSADPVSAMDTAQFANAGAAAGEGKQVFLIRLPLDEAGRVRAEATTLRSSTENTLLNE